MCAAWPPSRFRELFDVVHHAIQAPLRPDLGLATVIQPGQALVVPQVRKHRLDRADALAVELPTPWGINGLAHAFAGVVDVLFLGQEPADLASSFFAALGFAFEALLAQRKRPANAS